MSVTGTVEHKYWDKYDCHNGLDEYVPGFGYIKDSDGNCLIDVDRENEYILEAKWTEVLDFTDFELFNLYDWELQN